MSLADWLKESGAHAVEFDGAYFVYSHDRAIWSLSDYRVASISGPAVWLVPDVAAKK